MAVHAAVGSQANDASPSPGRFAELTAWSPRIAHGLPDFRGFSDTEFAEFMPWDAEATLPGEGSAFIVARGWASDPTKAVVSPNSGFVVPPRGLPPGEHLDAAAAAARGKHPLGEPPCIGEGAAIAIAGQLALGADIAYLRLRRIAIAEAWISELEPAQRAASDAGDPALRHFALKPSLAMLKILRIIGSPACEYLQDMHMGLSDIGEASRSGVFPPRDVTPPLWSVRALLEQAPLRNAELAEKVRKHHPHARELWDQGLDAEEIHALGPPRPVEEWLQEAGVHGDVVFCRKFPVKQAKWLDDDMDVVGDCEGEPLPLPECVDDIRACSDPSASPAGSGYNLAWAAAERIACSDADVILGQMLASQLAFGQPPIGTKEDLKRAYHQVPRSRRRIRVVQLFWDPSRKRVVGREQLSQDFGPAGAVTACNVVFRSLRDIACRWLLVNMDNYFDDYWFWEPPWSVASARYAVNKLFALLGYGFKPEKSQGGRRLPLVGLAFESEANGPAVRNKARRREPLARGLEDLAVAAPEPGSASTAIGKLIFASRGLQGKAGVHARRPLFAALKRVDEHVRNGQWPVDMQVALVLWARLLRRGPARALSVSHKDSVAAVLYGDAALSSRRAAAMLIIPAENGRPEFRAGFSVVLPPAVLRQLGPDEEHAINGAEVWWIAKSLEIWGSLLTSRCLLCFCDNRAGVAGCVSGYSRSVYVARMVGAVHDLLCQHQIAAWFEWVHSKSNPLDAASREDGEAALRRLHAAVVPVEPQLSTDLSAYHPGLRRASHEQ